MTKYNTAFIQSLACLCNILAQFLDSADINNSVMKMSHKLLHVFVQKHPVNVNRVSCNRTLSLRSVAAHKLQHHVFSFREGNGRLLDSLS